MIKSGVLGLHDVLIDELGDLSDDEKQQLAEHEKARAHSPERDRILYGMLHARKRSALCFSGGGIRSATFALGVLQGLAKRSFSTKHIDESPKMVAEFDFLSTVSGGGYIGSWFSSWVKRDGITNVLRQLSDTPKSKLDPEPAPVLYLRNYTNYLDPQLGLFSGDTWTLVATVVRNILLNWFVLIPVLASVLLIPVLYSMVLNNPLPLTFDWPLWLGYLLGVVGTGTLLHNLPSFGDRKDGARVFVNWCLAPLLAAAVCISTWWFWVPVNLAQKIPWYYFFGYGAAIHVSGVVLGIVLSKISHSENFKHGKLDWTRLLLTFPFAVMTGGVGAWLIWLKADAIRTLRLEVFAATAVPLVLLTLMAVGVLSVGVSSKFTQDSDREWWSRAGGWMMVAGLGWLVLFSVVLLLPLIPHDHAAFKSLMPTISAALAWYVTKTGSKSTSNVSEANAGTPAPKHGMLEKLEPYLMPTASVLFLVALAFGVTLVNTSLAGELKESWKLAHGATLILLLIEFTLATVASYGVNVNKFSLHAMYRMRLIRAYLGASNERRKPNPFTGFDMNDNFPISKLRKDKPMHVLNLCLNLVSGSNLAWQQRKAESFTVTRLHSGSLRVGYQSSETYGHGAAPGGISLGTAMAISGAAASPNMGYHSAPLPAIIMTLFNARLGWWLANPGEAGRRSWNTDGPTFGIQPFLAEAFGLTNDTNRYVYMSDGGHFENLGLYEMVLRRCRHIVVIDAGADDTYTKEDLGNAVRKIRIDLGIPISFESPIAINPKLGRDGKRCAIGTIDYQAIDGEDVENGELLYIKPVLTGSEPEDVQNYASTSLTFPQEPTSDQWFTESQFESYRRLGAFTIEEIVSGAGAVGALGIGDLFSFAKDYLARDKRGQVKSASAAGVL